MMRISDDEIHLWMVSDQQVTDEGLLDQYRSWLTEAEARQWQRFRFAKHRHQYLVTRALVRHVLTSYVPSIDERGWRFRLNRYGRPAIANAVEQGPRLQFNLSHTAGLAVVAIACHGDLGVDVECMHRSSQTVDIAERFFSADEVAQLRALPAEDQRERFFDLWTLKESYIKARGMGLSIPLDSFSFSFPDGVWVDLQVAAASGDRAEGWQFWQMRPSSAYRIALAYRHRQQAVRVQAWQTVPLGQHAVADCPISRQSCSL